VSGLAEGPETQEQVQTTSTDRQVALIGIDASRAGGASDGRREGQADGVPAQA